MVFPSNFSGRNTVSLRVLSIFILMMFFPLLSSGQASTKAGETDPQNPIRVEIAEQDLPARIQKDIYLNYSSGVFVEAFKFLDEGGDITQYVVRMQMDEGRALKIVYDKEGNPMKSEES